METIMSCAMQLSIIKQVRILKRDIKVTQDNVILVNKFGDMCEIKYK
jgi:hypothetical protein